MSATCTKAMLRSLEVTRLIRKTCGCWLADNRLQNIFSTLLTTYGPRHWWPGETPFEVCVGAIPTQNTNWGNVEKAVNLKTADRLSITGISTLLPDELQHRLGLCSSNTTVV